MIQLAASAAPIPSPLADKTEDDDVDIVLLQAGLWLRTGQIEGLHALVVADHGLGLLRALIRRGCPAAACVRPTARPEAAAYHIAFFLDVTPDTSPELLVHNARHAMLPGGRLVARMSFDPSGDATRGLARRLKLNGFINVRTLAMPGRSLLRADLPAVGVAKHQPVARHPWPITGVIDSHRRLS